jgi:hypothetical protein
MQGQSFIRGFYAYKPEPGFSIIGVEFEHAFITFDPAFFLRHHARHQHPRGFIVGVLREQFS